MQLSFLGVLAILFIGLKVLAIGMVASWPWWLVLLPLWIVPAILLVVFIVTYCYVSITGKRW